MRSDLAGMTKAELRAYVVKHPKDTEAFQLWVDRATADAPDKWYPAPTTKEDFAEMEQILQAKVEEIEQRKAS
jgi:hypothetical protein